MISGQWGSKQQSLHAKYARAAGYKNVHLGFYKDQRTQVSPTTNGQHNSSEE